VNKQIKSANGKEDIKAPWLGATMQEGKNPGLLDIRGTGSTSQLMIPIWLAAHVFPAVFTGSKVEFIHH
jgi:hypothetical protein